MYKRFVKRFLDIVLSGCAIIMLLPVLLIISIMVKVKLGSPVLFTQNRLGMDEKIFKLYKFRSMTKQKDDNGELLPDEVRLTNFGKILRSTSLDELPELLNIFIGDMSIIGPRPLLVEYLPYYTDRERLRHSVRPGLSGLAQMNGRNFLSWEEIFEYDIEYIQNLSFITDVKILFGTVIKLFNHNNVADVSAIEHDRNGDLYIVVDGKKKKLHKPLNIERRKSEDNAM